jgi:cytochrome c553
MILRPIPIALVLTLSMWLPPAGGAARPAGTAAKLPDKIEFNRDIRPILSDNCYACHGPDKNKRKADLRLDTKEGLLGKDGHTGVVVPNKPDESELWRRVCSKDDDRMQPAQFGKVLSDSDRKLLRRWIDQGAKWEGHWAFLPIGRPKPPAVKSGWAPKNDIDAFILEALDEHGLTPSPEADRITLLRRLRFDLTGLPPTTDEVDAFVADRSEKAYEKVVDRLLDSPEFGERMAMWWLDLVRYADSVGYHGDQPMSVSPFRDYVIKSFNENKSFDRFTLEQLAGDLLPNPTTEDKIASGYNRLGMMSAEGGVQPKEYLSKYISERVRNVSGTWLGATFGCCECHNHKFDPFLAKDFYSLEAFFADIEERGLYSGADRDGSWGPRLQLPTPQQQAERARLASEIAAVRKLLDTPTKELAAGQKKWESGKHEKLPSPIAAILSVSASKRSDVQRAELAAYYRTIAPELDSTRKKLADLQQAAANLEKRIPTTLITVSVTPRTIRLLHRGNWMDETGQVLTPAYPEVLSHATPREGRLTRADLARWLTSPQNPLTARTFVNRMWKLAFGAGLSRKLDDLGAQGEWPSHPRLLDWLAGQFIDSGWNVKHVVKLIVMSGTYRQSSQVTPALRDADPDNRWLARQGRFRLDAETVRDNALKISGLLVDRIGGPSVNPYQPPGYWSHLNFPPREWQNGTGADLYRRSLYTHWQR